MFKLFFSILTFALALTANAQMTRQWVATHNGQGDFNDRYTCLLRDPAGNYYLGGSTVNPGADRDFLIVKLDAVGQTLWTLQLDGEGHAADEVAALALSATGDVVATGISKGDNTSEDFWTLKIKTNGDTVWSRRYDFIGEYDQPNALSIDPAGNIVVAGLSDGDAGAGENDDYVTLKYSPDGQLLWSKRFNGLGDAIDRATGVVANGAGQVFVTGRSDNGTNDDYVTICYDANGNQQWIKYDDRGGRDRATAITLDFAGNVLIAGQSDNGDNDDFWILKYTPAGNPIWQKAYDFVDDDRALALATDATGNVFVTGQSDQNFDATRNWDIATVGFSVNGNPLWVARYDGPLSQDEFPTAIAVDAMGHLFVTGRGDSDPGTTIDNEIVVIRYQSSNGLEQWKTIYPGLVNRDNSSNAIYADESGGCLVAGYLEDSTAFRNALALHYNNAGAADWQHEFDGVGDNSDSARELAVDNAGNVYTAGYTISNGDNRNLSLIHFNPDGSFACRYVENGSAVSALDDAQGLILSDDERPIVMGYVKNSGTSNDIFIAKLNQTCDTLWDKNINGGANGTERPYDMVRDGAGNLILTGRSDQQAGPISNDVCYTLKLRETDGVTLWVRKYDADTTAGRFERGVLTRIMDPNQIYVAGRAFNGLDYDVFLLKYDANGNTMWVKSWAATASNEAPVDMALDASGNIYVLANTAPSSADSLHDMVLLKYNAAGALLWTVLYNDTGNGNDEAVALAVNAQGDILMTGKVDTKTGSAVAYGIRVLKHSPDGALTWAKLLSPLGDTDYSPDAMALRDNGQIFLAGHGNQGTEALPNINLLAYALDTNGNLLWSDSYDGTTVNGSDVPNSILLKGNDVYIAGNTEQPGQQRDLLLLKYSGTLVEVTTPETSTLEVYPNPARELLTIKGLPVTEPVYLEILDARGCLLLERQTEGALAVECQISNFPEGILFYRIFTVNRLLGAGKIYHSR